MVHKILFVSALFILLGGNLCAQRKSELFSLRYTYFAHNEVVDVFNDSPFGGLEITVQDLQLKGNIPVKLGKNTSLQNHLQYNLLRFNFQNWPVSVSNSEQIQTLHALSYTLDFKQNFGTGWGIRLMAQPGLASSFEDKLSKEDFVFQGNALIYKSFQADNQLLLGLGASYNTVFGVATLLPALDFYWKNRKWEVDMFFPYYSKMFYFLSDSWKIGLEGYIEGNEYNLGTSDAQAIVLQDYMQYNVVYGGTTVQWLFSDQFSWQVSGGLLINRTQEVYNNSEQVSADFDPDKFTPFYLQSKISFNLK